MAGRLLSLFKVFRGKTRNGHAAAQIQQLEELEQFQPLLDDAATDQTQEQDPARGRFSRAAQMLQRVLHVGRRNTTPIATEGTAQPDSRPTELQAKAGGSTASTACTGNSARAMADPRAKADVALSEGMAIANHTTTRTLGIAKTGTTPTLTAIHAPTQHFTKGVSSQQQVPAMVRDIHQRLMSHVTLDARLQTDILRLAEEHPADVIMTLLGCAPSCDRAAEMMWRAIGSSETAVEKVLPTLLCLMEDKPLFTIRGDNEAVFALAATVALWVIAQVPKCHDAIKLHSAHLFVALLSQIFITTEQMPEDVENFWRACREKRHLPTKPNRFAMQTLKALLCRLWDDDKVVALECKRVWDTLLCPDTQHYAVGLLAREMRSGLPHLCTPISVGLLRLLIREEPRWDLPILAFFVEVLECLDLSECGRRMLQIMSRHLRSECRERRRLALRGLVVLSDDPVIAEYMCSLSPRLVELLRDADVEVVEMTLSVLTHMLQDKEILVSSTTAPKLAEALLPLFKNDNSRVQLLSIHLFRKVMELVVKKGKKSLKAIVRQSLFSLLIYCHDENRRVAEASCETLLCAAHFLKRRDLKELLNKKQALKFDDCLLRTPWKPQPQPGEAPCPRCSDSSSGVRQEGEQPEAQSSEAAPLKPLPYPGERRLQALQQSAALEEGRDKK
ncbi:maestro heat-like repeat-containing protein family member 7 [Aphelocoma coerulescens]|uniref:maestro heat-like repeat-containing protein family member 7 n=1 Tax=Aphelocoma coerulescens TaxID=39617 RepID=UPI003605386C